MHKVLQALAAHCALDCKAHFVDVGAGLGRCAPASPTPASTESLPSAPARRRPLLHALLDPGVAACTGVELDRIKVTKAAAFFALTSAELRLRSISLKLTPTMHCSAIEQAGCPGTQRCCAGHCCGRLPGLAQHPDACLQVATLDPATHAYSFWEGVPPVGKAGLWAPVLPAQPRSWWAARRSSAACDAHTAQPYDTRLWPPCRQWRWCSVRCARHSPARSWREYGFGALTLVDRFPVSMSGRFAQARQRAR